MPISYVYTGEPMNGTAEDDFVIAYKGSTGTDNNTVNGNGGDDLVIADSSDTWIPNASYLNGSIATAFNLETLTSTWTTAENQMFGNWTIPHTTVMAEATIGQSEYFRVVIGAGQQITIDIDFASNTALGVPRDLVVELQDSLGNVIVTADDSLVTDGGLGSNPSTPGSVSSYDPYLVYTVANAGTYYINVRPFGGGPGSTFTENNTFLMNLSVTGHTVAAANPVQGNDTVNGGEGDDAIFGQGGADILSGGLGNDRIDGGTGGDIVSGGGGDDTLSGGDGSEENIHGNDGNDTLISGGEGHYYGDAGNDLVIAGLTAGVNEVLDGGADIDTLDTRTWNGAYTIDLAAGTSNFGEIFINFENLITGNGEDMVTGTAGANVITTNGGIDVVNAGEGDDVVSGGADGDDLDGGGDIDILSYRQSSGAVVINLAANTASGGHATGDSISNFEGVWGSVLGDTLTADAGNNELRGYEGNDTLSGGVGNDVLDGGINDDTMTGGLGDDTYYVDSLGDVINEFAGEGTDTLAMGFSYTLVNGAALENLMTVDAAATTAINLTGNSGVNAITGNAGVNVLTGNGGDDTLDGGGGADTLAGGDGNDTYYVDNSSDNVIETSPTGGTNDRVFASASYSLGGRYIELLTLTGVGNINGAGNNLVQTIIGNAGDNILDGLGGADTLNGGNGNDTYFVDDVGDNVIESSSGGGTSDRIISSVSYSLGGRYVETLTLAGAGNIDGTGNGLAQTIVGNSGSNVLTGNDGDDVLNGGAGADTMAGGGDNDTYYVDNAGDNVVESSPAWGDNDQIFSSVSYSLGGRYVEVLTLTGAGNINGIGNGLAQTIVGNSGNNLLSGNDGVDVLQGMGGDDALDGGTGADTMIGSAGNDTYFVDDVGDNVSEAAPGDGANDRVFSSVSYSLGGRHIEVLTLTGGGNINGTGNSLAQTIIGNAGNNVLDGLGGADTLQGGAGNDTYYVDDAGDSVVESAPADGANDQIFSSVTYSLGGRYIEVLTLTGAGNINGTGNGLAQTIIGNSGNNLLAGNDGVDVLQGMGGDDTLDGGGGADTMSGNAGNDTYFVNDAGDNVIESAPIEGTNDRVFASVSYSLGGRFIEIMTLTGGANINGTGNSLGQTIIGNSGINVLDGLGGNDVLEGGAGSDTFRFTTGLGVGNVDTITDYNVANDTIQVDNAVFTGLAAGALAAGAFNTGAAATQADDRIIYDSATGVLLFDVDGVGGLAGVQFATISTGLAMAASEFFVI